MHMKITFNKRPDQVLGPLIVPEDPRIFEDAETSTEGDRPVPMTADEFAAAEKSMAERKEILRLEKTPEILTKSDGKKTKKMGKVLELRNKVKGYEDGECCVVLNKANRQRNACEFRKCVEDAVETGMCGKCSKRSAKDGYLRYGRVPTPESGLPEWTLTADVLGTDAELSAIAQSHKDWVKHIKNSL